MARQMPLEMSRQQKWNLPDDTQRIVIVGTTGSGKTHAAVWHLGTRNFHQKPWVVYDWKRDDLINSIEGTFELGVTAPPPEHPGVYIVHPIYGRDDDAVTAQMTAIWDQEDIGVFVDECYMIAKNNDGFRNLLTQGRSKHIPMIICTQRPVWVDKFVFTESEFKQMFRLQSLDDQKKMKEYIPEEAIDSVNQLHPLRGKEMKYWSHYYDAPDDDIRPMRPLPDQQVIRSMFAAKLAQLKRVV
jgi:hypothetical protein